MTAALISGVIEGFTQFQQNTSTIRYIPWQNRAAKVAIEYEGELTFAETASSQGIFGNSAACLKKESAKIMVQSSNLTWGFLQQAVAQVDRASTATINRQETFTLAAAATTYTLATAPAASTPVILVDSDGIEYTGFTVTGTAVTAIPAGAQGKELTFIYEVAAQAGQREILVGSSATDRLISCSLYGRFRLCSSGGTDFSDLLFVAPNAVLKPKLSLSVDSSNNGSTDVEFELLRGSIGSVSGIYFALRKY